MNVKWLTFRRIRKNEAVFEYSEHRLICFKI